MKVAYPVRAGLFALLATCSTTALAQTSSESAAPEAEAQDTEIVVTGRAGAGERTRVETSYALTSIDNDALRSRAASSVTETLKSVPGFWVEASGGEGSGNVRARGIPVDGFGSINLLEDGLPVQHDPSLGYLNADQAFRVDESIERVEVVRGGPSSIFYPNAPGGVVNFITRKPGDSISGVARMLYGPTAELYRFDGWVGAPIGGGWGLSVGGFYRSEQGVRDPGFTGNKGGQIRADLHGDFGNGHTIFSYKHLSDNAIFYTGIPLTKDSKGDIVGLPGFDPHYGTTASRAVARMTLKSATGPVDFRESDGTSIRLDQLSWHERLGVRRRLEDLEQSALPGFAHGAQRRLSGVGEHGDGAAQHLSQSGARRLSGRDQRPAALCGWRHAVRRDRPERQWRRVHQRRPPGDGRGKRIARRSAPRPQLRDGQHDARFRDRRLLRVHQARPSRAIRPRPCRTCRAIRACSIWSRSTLRARWSAR